MSNYSDLLKAVEQYYGAGSDEWAEIAKYGIASDKAEQILKQVPGVDIWVNANGSVRSYNLKATENIASTAEQAINSNVPAEIKSFEIPSNSGIETVTSETGEAVKQMTFKSGMKQAGNFVFGEVAPRVAAVAAGITLGKVIDKAIYSFDPDFFDEHGMSTLNPDTWGEIIGTNNAGSRILNMILGTTPDGKSQAYMDENALAYMALYLRDIGVFNENDAKFPINVPTGNYTINDYISIKSLYEYASGEYLSNFKYTDDSKTVINNFLNKYGDKPGWIRADIDTSAYDASSPLTIFAIKDDKFKKGINVNIDYMFNSNYDIYRDGYYSCEMLYTSGTRKKDGPMNIHKAAYTDTGKVSVVIGAGIHQAYDLFLSSINASLSRSPDGISTQENAKTPDLSDDSSVEDVLNALKEQYPELWENAVDQDVAQPDGSTKTYTYVPVAMPEIDPEGNPVSSSSTQKKPQIDPAEDPEPLLDLISKIIQRDPPVNPPDIGSGITPIVPSSSGSASALYMIYNPTLAQINSFGAWLWSDNFVDQIKKLFNDPMQAIIGLHKVYATPATGGAQTIKVGYLDSGVSARVVSNQYTTIDCGTVRLSEQFHNVFDYSPYTEVNLYLPFIGIVNINVSDVMRSSIHIVYHVDVLSGACLAEVKVTRDSAGGTLYQYAGNASVTLPISSGSYMGIVSAVAGVAGGIAGTIASGGAALPLLASSAGAMFNAHTRVEHSGGFSGNAGAMGGKIPYLIISRPQTEMADGFENYIGYPSNFTATIGSCTGFIKVIECHVKSTTATNSELNEINTMLQEGVIV